ncbi:MAG: histidine--tRNA ligase [Clostridia bacterium]
MISKLPPKGMRDFLPSQVRARNLLLQKIRETYSSYGFVEIETPCIEDISLLLSKQGGDNEKLMYKILKRGDKLAKSSNEDLCDLGLRFDLTLPLSRYYANNIGSLPPVFKVMHIGNVFRADRPQNGRYRQFVQCDIDIINEPTILAEIELINATSAALFAVGIRGAKVIINDRNLLKLLASYCGFAEEQYDEVFITLDKLDKIGYDSVYEELITTASKDASAKLVATIQQIRASNDQLNCVRSVLGSLAEPYIDSLSQIICSAEATFDITLVRGMNYYTGTIFEVTTPELPYSVAGGGRYDKLIEKVSGTPTCACGFSIGFERISAYLGDNVDLPKQQAIAFVFDKAYISQISKIFDLVKEYRKDNVCSIFTKSKNFSYQIKSLYNNSFTAIMVYNGNTFEEI